MAAETKGRLNAMAKLIRSLPDLIDEIRARRDELQITHECIDDVAGLSSGYASKLLAPDPIKHLGPMSFEAVLGALGVALVLVEDSAQVARVSPHWTKRKRPQRKSRLEQEPS
jgi:hypothetical protein